MSLLNNPFDTTREAALVTGAGNGIGRAIAQALVGEGVRTVFADVSAEGSPLRSQRPLGRSWRCHGLVILGVATRGTRCWPTPGLPWGR